MKKHDFKLHLDFAWDWDYDISNVSKCAVAAVLSAGANIVITDCIRDQWMALLAITATTAGALCYQYNNVIAIKHHKYSLPTAYHGSIGLMALTAGMFVRSLLLLS